MTTPQQPLGSPFGRASTASDVIAGVDLAGRTAIVTGGYSGIGVETVRALVSAGARVIVPARDAARAEAALAPFGDRVTRAAMDLEDLASVRAFARSAASTLKAVHLLVNNAGIMACPEGRIGPGWERQFAVNHIGHFVLTEALTPLLAAAGGARVVQLSSSAHKRTDILWDDIHFVGKPYEKWTAYGQSKTANALFARGLDARLKAQGVRAFSVHPGAILTDLTRHLSDEDMLRLGWTDRDGKPTPQALAMLKTPEQGAATSVWAATSRLLDDLGGVYCEDCDVGRPWEEGMSHLNGVKPWITSDEGAERLWRETTRMLEAA